MYYVAAGSVVWQMDSISYAIHIVKEKSSTVNSVFFPIALRLDG